ncbi:MAG: DUF1761 domain-containing protein [Nitrospinae bacterium]|nr:DUF1761 domain-containing protein [Nitrospinota bacterium]
MLPINLLSVLVSAIVAFVLGFLFHGPVSGKLWMKLANIHPTGNEKFSDMYGKMFWNFVVNLVTAFGLANIILVSAVYHHTEGSAISGMAVGFWVWLSFLVTSSSIEVIWMGRSWKLWLFEAGCSLIIMATMGSILAAW